MDIKGPTIQVVLAFLVLSFASGCAGLGDYGKVNSGFVREEKVAIETLMDNWHAYDIYYAGYYSFWPSAILFDPKGDDRQLVHDDWIRVEDPQTLSDLVAWMRNNTQVHAEVRRILGPDDRLYGYLFSPLTHIVLKKVDERTMYVYDVPYSPDFYDRDFRDRDG